MYKILYSGQFKKDLKLLKKRSPESFNRCLEISLALESFGRRGIHPRYKPHSLHGQLKGCFECHVENDTLLIWMEDESDNTIVLIRTGTHSDLFE